MNITIKCHYMLLFVCICVSCDCWAQDLGKKVVLGSGNGLPEYYVASLPKNSTSVFEKLKIQVFGGHWTNIDLGESTYYISSRNSLQINQERHGGSASRYALLVYDNGSSYDFVIKVTGSYPSFFIRAWKIAGGGVSGIQELPISNYDPTGKVDITAQIPVNRIFITSEEGNIGLGTDPDADYRLSVNGKVRAKEVKVEAANWPDYVFERGYELPTLDEVEAYVKEHKHLPEIPSAKEIEKDGLDLAEMNLLLMKKVEELTLYLVEERKARQTLERRLNAFESKKRGTDYE